jgi:hypothetical protein
VLTVGTLLSCVFQFNLNNQGIFNKENETFPQEEGLIKNERSVNLPAQYNIMERHAKAGSVLLTLSLLRLY